MRPDSPALTARQVRQLALRYGITPTKAWGQNFVIDPNTVRRIVAAAGPLAGQRVVEVGPGLGCLTLGLLDAVGPTGVVVAVEIDPRLAAALPVTVGELAPELAPRLHVLPADALRLLSEELATPTALVANLPYNVAVPVVLHLLAIAPSIASGLVMVQAEVADRLVAAPGSRIYGVPSVKLAWHAAARRAGAVPRSVFWPAPRVDSALVEFTRREPPPGTPRQATFAVVDAAFAQRRKGLRAALAGLAGSTQAAEQALRAAGIDPAARAETLDVQAFARLAAALPDLPVG